MCACARASGLGAGLDHSLRLVPKQGRELRVRRLRRGLHFGAVAQGVDVVGAGAQVLGPITIGRCARIGGNSVVTKDVPEAMTVVGVPARPIPQKASTEDGFKAYAVTPEAGEDFREKTIQGLSQEITELRRAFEAMKDESSDLPVAKQARKSSEAQAKK